MVQCREIRSVISAQRSALEHTAGKESMLNHNLKSGGRCIERRVGTTNAGSRGADDVVQLAQPIRRRLCLGHLGLQLLYYIEFVGSELPSRFELRHAQGSFVEAAG